MKRFCGNHLPIEPVGESLTAERTSLAPLEVPSEQLVDALKRRASFWQRSLPRTRQWTFGVHDPGLFLDESDGRVVVWSVVRGESNILHAVAAVELDLEPTERGTTRVTVRPSATMGHVVGSAALFAVMLVSWMLTLWSPVAFGFAIVSTLISIPSLRRLQAQAEQRTQELLALVGRALVPKALPTLSEGYRPFRQMLPSSPERGR